MEMELQIFKKSTGELVAWFGEDGIMVRDDYDIRIGEDLRVMGDEDEIYGDAKNHGKRKKVYIAGKGKKLQSKSMPGMSSRHGR